MVDTTNSNTLTSEVMLAEMRATAGWGILLKSMRDKHAASASALVTGSKADIEDVIIQRTRAKLIREILADAGLRKEELIWKELL